MNLTETLYDFDLESIPAFREEESIFSRGEDDQLIKYAKPTGADFVKTFQVIFDGEFVEVPKALPATDALGNRLKDNLGNLIARDTTIYDVAEKLVSLGRISETQMQRKLPVLCHQKHLEPIAVCRVCSVHISKMKRGKFEADRKLHAACIRPVEDKMAIVTGVGPEDPLKHIELIAKHFEFDLARRRNEQETQEQATQRAVKAIEGYSTMVRQATGLLGELLAAECLRPDPERGRRYDNELERVASAIGDRASNRLSQKTAALLVFVAIDPRRPRSLHSVRPLRPLVFGGEAVQGHWPYRQGLSHPHQFRPRFVDERFELRAMRRMHDGVPDGGADARSPRQPTIVGRSPGPNQALDPDRPREAVACRQGLLDRRRDAESRACLRG
jgi:hypothetical protein